MTNRQKLENLELHASFEAIEDLLREIGEDQVRKELEERLKLAAEATKEISINKVVDPGFFDKVFTV